MRPAWRPGCRAASRKCILLRPPARSTPRAGCTRRNTTGGECSPSRSTKRFHAIAEALAALKPKILTLDGEVAVFDAELISRFEWLRHINHGDLATPPLFMVFDLLQLNERDYRSEPLKVRRKAAGRTLKWLKVKQSKYREEARRFYKP